MALRSVVALSVVHGSSSTFARIDGENAVPNGSKTKEKSVDACEATCVGDCIQYSWSEKTGHCYISSSDVWTTSENKRIHSGCVVEKVSGCPGAPPSPTPLPTPTPPPTPPTPPPTPTPAPGGMPPFNSAWYRSDTDKINITYPEDETHGMVMRWTKPKKPTVLLTYLPEATSLAKIGDEFRTRIGWRSDGGNKCDPWDWQDGRTCSCGQDIKETCEEGKGTPSCAKSSVNCIEGTGDFRIALWDTVTGSGTHETIDGFVPGASGDDMHAYMDQLGADYRGYQYRFMPHVATTYYHPKSSEPGGFFCKKTGSTDPFEDHRLPGHWGDENSGVFAGFGVPNSEWSYLELGVARRGSKTYELSIEMAGQRYNYTHTWDSEDDEMPQFIDALGIWFPNSRSYDFVELSTSSDLSFTAVV